MLNLTQSIHAMRLAIKIVHGSSSGTGRHAIEFLELYRLNEGSPRQTDEALIQSGKDKAKPWFPILLMFSVTTTAYFTGIMMLLGFIPAFLFAAYGAWLFAETLDRITPLVTNDKNT